MSKYSWENEDVQIERANEVTARAQFDQSVQAFKRNPSHATAARVRARWLDAMFANETNLDELGFTLDLLKDFR